MNITLQCVYDPIARNVYFLNGNQLTHQDLKASLLVRNHSPDGFNHGYSGSGPSQLALAICLKIWGQLVSLSTRSLSSGILPPYPINIRPLNGNWT